MVVAFVAADDAVGIGAVAGVVVNVVGRRGTADVVAELRTFDRRCSIECSLLSMSCANGDDARTRGNP